MFRLFRHSMLIRVFFNFQTIQSINTYKIECKTFLTYCAMVQRGFPLCWCWQQLSRPFLICHMCVLINSTCNVKNGFKFQASTTIKFDSKHPQVLCYLTMMVSNICWCWQQCSMTFSIRHKYTLTHTTCNVKNIFNCSNRRHSLFPFLIQLYSRVVPFYFYTHNKGHNTGHKVLSILTCVVYIPSATLS